MANMADDDFEFEAVPKFLDFKNDENEGALHDRSAFFHGDGPIHPTPHKPRAEAAAVLQEPLKAPSKEKIPVPAVLAEKNVFEEKKPVGCTSNLALFNPSASRLKEKARRRSQQIQVQEETKPAPKIPTGRRTPSQNPPFTRSREAAAVATHLAEKKNLEEKKLRPFTRSREAPTAAAEQKTAEEKKKQPVGFNSNLALFNPAASRLQERARRRSQQIQVKEDPTKPAAAAASKNLRRPPLPQTPPRSQRFVSSDEVKSRIQASVERLSAPKHRQDPASALNSVAGTPKKVAEPTTHRRLLRAGTIPSIPPKKTPEKPEAFKQKLRSYKPSTGKTPSKPLTVPQPYNFHRSRSQCRDTEANAAKPFKIDAKIRESVNRLSAPRKRESAIGNGAAARK